MTAATDVLDLTLSGPAAGASGAGESAGGLTRAGGATALAVALAALDAAREKVAEVEGRSAAYTAELAGIEAPDPVRMLDDPDGSAEDADRAEALRRRIRIHDQALDVAQERVTAAMREALLVEAAAHEPAIAAARAAVDEHLAEVDRLHARLVEVSGRHWAVSDAAAGEGGRQSVEDGLRAEVAKAERPAEILRAAANGHRVDAPYDELPECLQRGGWADLGWTRPAEVAARRQAEAVSAAGTAREAIERAERVQAAYVAACEEWKRTGDGAAVTKAYFAAEDAREVAAQAWNRMPAEARGLVEWRLGELLPPPWGRVPTRTP